MLKDLKEINQKRSQLEEKYSGMRKEVFQIKQIKLYKPVKGDAVDEMFAGYLNKAQVDINVRRISASNYMFGSKKILAKIINGRLVIRVGGGYMNAEEFIEQYGKIEMMKIIKQEEVKAGGTESDIRKSMRRGTIDVNALKSSMRDQMKDRLSGVNPYEVKRMQTSSRLGMPRQSVAYPGASNKDLRLALDGLKKGYRASETEQNPLNMS